MANVGRGNAGNPLTGKGISSPPSFLPIGTYSGLTAHGVLIAEGLDAFTATSVGVLHQVLTSNGPGFDPTFQTISALGAITSITGDTGTGFPSSGNFNIEGGAALSAGTNASVTLVSGATLTVTSINCAKWIVDATANRGTHTTIAAAISAASSGQTIFIRPGTYTENLVLKAGVNLTAFGSDGSLNNTGNVTIVGSHGMTTAGSVTISGTDLQATTEVISITGSAASVVNLVNCYLEASSGAILAGGSSSASSQINVMGCTGDVGSTGSVFSWSSSGTLNITNAKFTNSGGSSVQSTISSGIAAISNSSMGNGISCTSTGLLKLDLDNITTTSNTAITHGGSTSSYARNCIFSTGGSQAVSISTTLGLYNCVIDSTVSPPVTGAGTVIYSSIDFSNTGSGINTSTKTSRVLDIGSLILNTASINQILYSSASNVVAGLATANNGVLTTGATGIPVITQLASDGQFIIGSSSGAPAAANLIAGTGITIVNAANSITLSASSSGFSWTDVTGATQIIAAENGYITDRGGGVTYTLPASGSLGDTFKIVGKSGIATITPLINQQLLIGSASGAVGVTGTAVSSNAGDCIEFVCITSGASTVWRASNYVGNWTLTM